MKISDHTIYASNRTPKFEKTSVPSVVNEQTTSGSDISLTNSAFTQFRTSNYTWGLDLSQTLQGAGGVGGLLSLSIPNSQFVISNYYYTYDANGNVSELIDTAGVVKAHYEYSPFGKVVHKSGPLADKNPFQFSTKYLDNETQLYYYGYRYYNPENGRWINRDPIGERGGYNLYGFVYNNEVNNVDYLGLSGDWKEVVTSKIVETGTWGDDTAYKKEVIGVYVAFPQKYDPNWCPKCYKAKKVTTRKKRRFREIEFHNWELKDPGSFGEDLEDAGEVISGFGIVGSCLILVDDFTGIGFVDDPFVAITGSCVVWGAGFEFAGKHLKPTRSKKPQDFQIDKKGTEYKYDTQIYLIDPKIEVDCKNAGDDLSTPIFGPPSRDESIKVYDPI